MKKSELIAKIAQNAGISKAAASAQLDSFLAIITDELAAGGSVDLGVEVGKFQVADVKERNGRNPSNNEPLVIPAHKKPVFKPAKALKDRVKSA